MIKARTTKLVHEISERLLAEAAMRGSEEKSKNIGIKAFLMKPLIKKHIAETVREVLDQR